MSPIESAISVKVFICYSHADQELRQELEEHLSPLIHSSKITIWQDQKIPLGANWKDLINTRLNEADLILPLVSSNKAYSHKGWALNELKRYEEALDAYEQAIRIDPNYALPYNNKGHALKQLGRQREADLAYAKARQLGYKP